MANEIFFGLALHEVTTNNFCKKIYRKYNHPISDCPRKKPGVQKFNVLIVRKIILPTTKFA